MSVLRRIADIVSRWLEVVAATVVAAFGRSFSPRVVQIVEEDDGAFTLRAAKDGVRGTDRFHLADPGAADAPPAGVLKAVEGNRVELVLRPSRFVFKQLELPRRAVEFLDGIIRAQIDRLTPWTAADAVFGWGRPTDIAR